MNRVLAARALAALALLAPLAASAAPTLQDFARGMTVTPLSSQPVLDLDMPDEAYAGVLRADLGDLRVFNAAGIVVPHALCEEAPPPPQPYERTLGVFMLQAGPQDGDTGTRIEVETRDGTQVRVEEPGALTQPSTAQVSAYVIDATYVDDPLRAIRVNWQSRDGASEVAVRVETADDLDGDWRTVVKRATLLRSAGGELERLRIALPLERYRYLRLERSGGGEPPQINEVVAEVVPPPIVREPRLVPAVTTGQDPDAATFLFDAGRQAPMSIAQVRLPMTNMSLRVELASSTQAEGPFAVRWTGEVVSVDGREPEPANIEQTRDRWWRLRVLRGVESLGGSRPMLELGYLPARLRFLAQGQSPFTLAFGSARVEPALVPQCAALLGDVPPEQLPQMLGEAQADLTPGNSFGGEDALTPAPEPTPVRLIVLWVVLGFAVLVLVLMALALLKRVRQVP